MCHNKGLFCSLKTLSKPSTVTLPDGKCISVTHTGTVVLSEALSLRDVLYIPSFRYNLLSVSKLASQLNGYVIFSPRHCFLQALSLKKPLVLGEYYAGLYLLKTQSFTSLVNDDTSAIACHSSFCNVGLVSGGTWHVRLGHLPLSKLQTLGLFSENVDVSSITQCLISSNTR